MSLGSISSVIITNHVKEVMDPSFVVSPPELVLSKIKAFKSCIEFGSDCLTKRDFSNAQMVYGSVLSDLHHGGFDSVLSLNELDVFSLHMCFAYASVGADFKSESALTILNRIDTGVKMPLLFYLKVIIHTANNRMSFALDDLQHCEALLKDGYNFKSNNILNHNNVPEVNDEFLKKKVNGQKIFCELLISNDEDEDIKDCLKKTWMQLGTLCSPDFDKFKHSSLCLNDLDKVVSKRVETLLKKNLENASESNTGAIKKTKAVVKVKKESKPSKKCMGVQTETSKGVNIAVQTSEKYILSQISNTVTDIRNKMNNLQNKKDTEMKQLQKKSTELCEKFLVIENQRQGSSSEFDFLKNQYSALEKKLEESKKQVEFLQKLLVEQMQHKFYLQKSIYQMFEEKCGYKIDYLCEIQQCLQSGNAILSDECGQEAFMWKKSLDKIADEKNNFDVFYKGIDNLIINKQYKKVNVRDWPGLPLIQSDVHDIVHRNFKILIQQGKAFAVPPYHNFNTLFNKYANGMSNTNDVHCRQDGQIAESPQVYPREPGQGVSHHVEPKPNTTKNKPDSSIRPSTSPEKKTNLYDSKHELLKYLHLNFEDYDETEVFEALNHIRDLNGGTVKNFPPSVLVLEIKKYFKKKKGTKSWKNVNQVQWQNDHSESTCVICFEEFNATNNYSLVCQHEFHKLCITNWLKRQGVCPICRVHAVIDEDFPPLSK